MTRSTRKTAVIVFGIAIAVALAAYAGSDLWFEATGTATYTSTYSELDKDHLDMTSGADVIQLREGNDVINLGLGADTLAFHSNGTNEQILFNLDGNSYMKYMGASDEVDVSSGGDVVITIGAGQ